MTSRENDRQSIGAPRRQGRANEYMAPGPAYTLPAIGTQFIVCGWLRPQAGPCGAGRRDYAAPSPPGPAAHYELLAMTRGERLNTGLLLASVTLPDSGLPGRHRAVAAHWCAQARPSRERPQGGLTPAPQPVADDLPIPFRPGDRHRQAQAPATSSAKHAARDYTAGPHRSPAAGLPSAAWCARRCART